jgi:hypothetical protein
MSFALWFESITDLLLNAGALVLLVWAFIDSATRRKEAFPAIGTLPKPGWMIILGLVALLVGFTLYDPNLLLMMIGYAAALIYLLDVRRGIRDLAQGSW